METNPGSSADLAGAREVEDAWRNGLGLGRERDLEADSTALRRAISVFAMKSTLDFSGRNSRVR